MLKYKLQPHKLRLTSNLETEATVICFLSGVSISIIYFVRFQSLRHKASSLRSWNSPHTCKTKAFDWLRGGKAGKRAKFAFVFSSFGHTCAGPPGWQALSLLFALFEGRVSCNDDRKSGAKLQWSRNDDKIKIYR